MSEPTRIVRSYEAQIDDVKTGERSVVARINTAAVDRYRTVIEPMGVKLDNYRKNPVVLWEHGLDPNRGSLPIGRNVWVKARKTEGDIIAKTQYRDDDFSRSIFEMYRDGTLKGFSVGMVEDPGETSPPTPAEVRARPELAECRCMYRSTDLIEYSSVATAGNPEALALAVSRGLWVPEDLRAGLPSLDGLPPLPDRPELPPFVVRRRLSDVIEQRRATVRAYARQELDDLHAQLDLKRGVV